MDKVKWDEERVCVVIGVARKKERKRGVSNLAEFENDVIDELCRVPMRPDRPVKWYGSLWRVSQLPEGIHGGDANVCALFSENEVMVLARLWDSTDCEERDLMMEPWMKDQLNAIKYGGE